MLVSEELDNITSLIRKGNHKDALSKIQDLEKAIELSEEDLLTRLFLKCKIFIKLGKYEETISLSQQLLRESERTKHRLREIDALIIEAGAIGVFGRYNQALELIDRAESALFTTITTQAEEVRERQASLAFERGKMLYKKGEVNNSLEDLQMSLDIREEIREKNDIIESANLIGLNHQALGDFDRGREYFEKSLKIAKEIENKQKIAESMRNIGRNYYSLGNLKRALDYQQKSLKIYEEIGNQRDNPQKPVQKYCYYT